MVGDAGVTASLQRIQSFVQAPWLPQIVREQPVLAAVVIGIVTLVLLVVVAAVVRWLRRPKGVRFARAIGKRDRLTVLMHPNPDPDAMACALAVAHLAESRGTQATVRYSGQIRHHENRAFRTVLDFDCERIETAEDLPEGPVVLVDHNKPRGFTGSDGLSPFAVVDHHPGGGTGVAFTDVRPEYGACASIITEYFRDLGFEPLTEDGEPDRSLPIDVATGLLFGILADTDHLTRGATRAEFEASAYLYPGIDEDSIERIANPSVDAETLDVKARAIQNRDVRSPFMVSDVGEISNVDAIPQAADELLRLEGVSAVVVMGQSGNTLHLSGRSQDDRVHMGEVLESSVADIPMSGAGGHARMGGGQISAPHMEGLTSESGMSREDLKERIFDGLTGNA